MKKKKDNQVALKLENLVKVYGTGDNTVTALKGVTLSFRKSEFVSILGPSGCGKTTLLNIIGGLDRYTEGDLSICGTSTKNFADSDWDTYRNNSVGFVFQSYNLIPHQTVLSNVELALKLSGISKNERHKRALSVLEKVGLKGLENKMPNQMSGGQMQRVAIARALVNDPEIILADEPTGALDTETSVQVLDLLKEVSKDRLVIMVTHNPDLAKKYSTRTITLLDGLVTGDSNPCEDSQPCANESKKGKAQMKLGTAFSLSLSNLKTKKGRTILTSIAGSIGIIGIALVLALSTGFSAYIHKLQADTLSVYPVTVSEATIDLTDFEKITQGTGLEKFPKLKEVYTSTMFSSLSNMLKSNKITDEYVDYVKNFVDDENGKIDTEKQSWKYCLQEEYGFDVNDFVYADIGINLQDGGEVEKQVMPVDALIDKLSNMFNVGMQASELNISAEFVREYIPTMSEIPENLNLIQSQYDLLDGDWATEEDELLLVVDERNQVNDITLALLGFKTIEGMNPNTYSVEFGGKDTFTFEEIYAQEFYYIKNDTRYVKLPTGAYMESVYDASNPVPAESDGRMTLKIKGIVRKKADLEQGVLDNGIAYTSKFVQKILSDNVNSAIANESKTSGKVNVVNLLMQTQLDPTKFLTTATSTRELAGNDHPNKLAVYSYDYSAKEQLKTYLDAWNERENILEEDKVYYSDSTAVLFTALNFMVDAVKIVLIFFTAISLVVSSIMIGIITYVSVVERTKEIGILRSIGARKKDISRIFNAETFLIGLFAGLIGIGVTYLLSIPINLIVASLVTNAGNICALKITDAGVLIIVSFVLTLISGIIPSRIAAKKDPVVALRTE